MHKIILGDCFDRIQNIPDKFADLIILDPPYGKTALKWDKKFDVKLLDDLFRVVTNNGVIIIFGKEPMLSHWRIYGEQYFKYDLIWKKHRKNGYVHAKDSPLSETEKISVFSKGKMFQNSKNRMSYYPQLTRPCYVKYKTGKRQRTQVSGCHEGQGRVRTMREYPTDILQFDEEWKPYHQCEKPIELFEYLILTYTQLNETVVDPCFGSGNSLLAAKNLHRNYIGIEQDNEHYERFSRISTQAEKEPELSRAS